MGTRYRETANWYMVSARYEKASSMYQMPSTWSMCLATMYQATRTRCQTPDAGNQVTNKQINGRMYPVSGSWYKLPGSKTNLSMPTKNKTDETRLGMAKHTDKAN